MNYGSSWYNDFKKSDSNWGTVNWPNVDSNTKIDFYAHDGGTFYYNDGNPYVNFTMDNNAFSQKDLLVATHKNISLSESGGVVSLDFDHACAAVQFNVYKEENASYTVNSIILKNVKNAGSYYYDVTPHWQTTNGTADYTLTNSDITVTTDKKLLPCKWLFIIPQSKAGIQIEINYNGNKQKTLNLSGTWEAGTKYTVDIRIGKSA